MTTSFQQFTVSPLCAVLLIVVGALAVTPAQADDRGMALLGAVNTYRATCGPVRIIRNWRWLHNGTPTTCSTAA